jgi:hypothetical protein
VIESVMSQYCGFNSADGVVWYLTFQKPRRVEAQGHQGDRQDGGGQPGVSIHPWD